MIDIIRAPEVMTLQAHLSLCAYWRCVAMPIVQEGLSKEILARAGYYSVQTRYEHVYLCD